MVIGRNSLLLDGKVNFSGSFCLTVEFRWKRDNFQWLCTLVYGPNVRTLKASFWEEIRRSNSGISHP